MGWHIKLQPSTFLKTHLPKNSTSHISLSISSQTRYASYSDTYQTTIWEETTYKQKQTHPAKTNIPRLSVW